MSDDKALREAIRRQWAYTVPKQDLIDRIEELEANINIKADFIDATINQLAASDQRIEELEAKLGEYNLLWQTYELDKVVAELKGQKDER